MSITKRYRLGGGRSTHLLVPSTRATIIRASQTNTRISSPKSQVIASHASSNALSLFLGKKNTTTQTPEMRNLPKHDSIPSSMRKRRKQIENQSQPQASQQQITGKTCHLIPAALLHMHSISVSPASIGVLQRMQPQTRQEYQGGEKK